MMPWGSNGQWVRARDERGAKAFIDEQKLAAENRNWVDEQWSSVGRWIANLVRRMAGRPPKP